MLVLPGVDPSVNRWLFPSDRIKRPKAELPVAVKVADPSCLPSNYQNEPRASERRLLLDTQEEEEEPSPPKTTGERYSHYTHGGRSVEEIEVSLPTSLDIDRNISARSCRVVGWVSRKAGRGMKAFPVYCGRWDCSFCAKRKGKLAFARIWNSPAKNFQRLLTLTFRVSEKYSLQEQSDRSGPALSAFWSRLEKLGMKPQYVWVREVGKNKDMVHFHVLVDHYLDQGLLKRIWLEVTGDSHIVDIRYTRCSARYICKYLAKMPDYEPEVFRCLAGKRKYSASRGLLAAKLKCPEWAGATFAVVSPMAIGYRCLAVIDGVFYLECRDTS